MTPPVELWLSIWDCRCRCGNQWVTSRVRHINGGTPPPEMEAKGTCVGYDILTHHTDHCHRCVPLQLGIGWTRPAAQEPEQPKKPRGLYE